MSVNADDYKVFLHRFLQGDEQAFIKRMTGIPPVSSRYPKNNGVLSNFNSIKTKHSDL